MQSVAFIIGFTEVQNILFKACDCRSVGVVPANTLKRLVRKRKYINIYFIKKLYSEVGFELLPTKNSTIVIQMLYPLSYCTANNGSFPAI